MANTAGFRELLANEFAPYGKLSARQLDQLEEHYRLLEQWNARMNLTRIRHLEEIVRLHYCESLFLGTVLPRGPLSVADVGSGAGFPGIPLAIIRPECKIALIESHQRKAVFLREASRSVANVRVIDIRAEEVQESFDWAISRAVKPDEVMGLGLAPRIALLVGRGDSDRVQGEKVSIPWSQDRFIIIVPRGTSSR